jgi:hypothetical protein
MRLLLSQHLLKLIKFLIRQFDRLIRQIRIRVLR